MSPLKGDPLHNGIIQAVPGGLAPHVTCFLFLLLGVAYMYQWRIQKFLLFGEGGTAFT